MANSEIELKELLSKDKILKDSNLENNPVETTKPDTKEYTAVPTHSTDSLHRIASTQEQLSNVKDNLNTFIDSLVLNPSMISRAADYWGALPMWQKIVGGVVVSAPTLAIGLLPVSALNLAIYATSSIVLDEHHTCSVDIADRLKKGVLSMANILEVVITDLESIRTRLGLEIERFKEENLKLTEYINTLSNEIESLTNQVEVLIKTEEILRENAAELEKTNESLKSQITIQADLIDTNQQKMELIRHDYKKNQESLSEKMIELSAVNRSLTAEVAKAKSVTNVLQGTLNTLSGTVLSDKKHQESFKANLDKMVNNSQTEFSDVANRMLETERELARVKQELNESNGRYNELLERGEKQIARLEALFQEQAAENQAPTRKESEFLSLKGLFHQKQPELTPTSPLISRNLNTPVLN